MYNPLTLHFDTRLSANTFTVIKKFPLCFKAPLLSTLHFIKRDSSLTSPYSFIFCLLLFSRHSKSVLIKAVVYDCSIVVLGFVHGKGRTKFASLMAL